MTEHAARAHARFGASSAHRWMACPGSVRLSVGLPDVPSEAALEGTRAHELLEAMLVDDKDSPRRECYENTATSEIYDAVRIAVEYVRDLMDEHPDAVLLVEQKFDVPVAAAPGEVFGTADVVVLVPSLRLIYVVDYKHGAGHYVEVVGNKQARFYALGTLHAEFLRSENWVFDTVCMTIVQPRVTWAEPIREWWVPVEQVAAFADEIGAAIIAAKRDDAPLVPGEEQCKFCPARVQLFVLDSFRQ